MSPAALPRAILSMFSSLRDAWRMVAAAILLGVTAGGAQAADKVVFVTNWYAEAEHGGFYQALAEGIYQRHGLDVTIRMGGPQVNVYQLLLAGQADFAMGYDIATLNAVEQGLPLVTVAATFQADPAVMIAHPDVKDLADKNVAQQGYATSEPYSIQKGGVNPKVFLLATNGYPPYAETIVTVAKTVKDKPDMIRRFVEASALGWKSYLANPAPGNALIKRDNPQLEDDLLAFGVARMKDFGLVTGGEAATQGILTMTDARWKQTFDFMAQAGLIRRDVDYRKAYTLDFVKQSKVLP